MTIGEIQGNGSSNILFDSNNIKKQMIFPKTPCLNLVPPVFSFPKQKPVNNSTVDLTEKPEEHNLKLAGDTAE